LVQLVSTKTIEYQNQFSRLLLRAGKLSLEQQVGCFVSGLKENLRVDVQACRPASLSAAIGLVRLYETSNQASKSSSQVQAKRAFNNPSSPRKQILLIKRLSPDELSEHRAKGLCFNCNKKFRPGHPCRKLCSIEGSLVEENDEEAQEDVEESIEEVPKISFNAIYGARVPQTMRVIGSLGRQGHKVNFLIDSGSTHDFLNHNIAKKNWVET
ncbi:hypothetical protein CFOL_v3_29647, partial [Cephalotus follicularis]